MRKDMNVCCNIRMHVPNVRWAFVINSNPSDKNIQGT